MRKKSLIRNVMERIKRQRQNFRTIYNERTITSLPECSPETKKRKTLSLDEINEHHAQIMYDRCRDSVNTHTNGEEGTSQIIPRPNQSNPPVMELRTDSFVSLEKNPISAFMEYGQSRKARARLELIKTEGPSHEPTFTVGAYLGDQLVCSVQSGRVKDGRESAAEKALRNLFSSNQEIIYPRLQGIEQEETSPVPGRDPVSVLMEYAQAHGKTAKFETLSKSGPDHEPTFTIVALLGSERFEIASGSQIKQVKKKAAIKALNTIEKKTKYFSKRQRPVSAISRTSTAVSVPNDVCPIGKNPVSVFMEYAQEKRKLGDFTETMVTGPPHNRKFTYVACLDDEEFPKATGRNKKEAKRNAAILALKTLQDRGLYNNRRQISASNTSQAVVCTTFEDKIAALCHQHFTKIVADVPEDLKGRKVIAGIVLIDEHAQQIKVVSMGSGNRCITGDKLSMDGNVIGDSHAEIIAKRGFRRYLYRSITEFMNGNNDTIIHRSKTRKFRIRDGVTFHLYISTAPCGDSAIFTHNDPLERTDGNDSSHNPIFDNDRQGQLRTKIENGEGTIPVSEKDSVQTWDGIQRGERLRTMSCSDKICFWNVLGIQGALLSSIMDPVYLKTVTLGQLYNHGHLCRAVCCRVDLQNGEYDSDLPRNFMVNHPKLGRVTAFNVPRNTEKSRAYSINWNICDKSVEVTDGTTGRPVQNNTGSFTEISMCTRQSVSATASCDDKNSRLSKSNFYKLFKQICKTTSQKDLIGANYHQSKQLSTSYQRAKCLLKNRFLVKRHGKWLSKPLEAELFE